MEKSSAKTAANAELDEARTDVILKSEFGDDLVIQNNVDYDLERKEVMIKIEATFPEEQETTDDFLLRAKNMAEKIFGPGANVVIGRPTFQFFTIEKKFQGA